MDGIILNFVELIIKIEDRVMDNSTLVVISHYNNGFNYRKDITLLK